MDETFHGYNAADGRDPSQEIVRIDTLMHSARRAHRDFRIHYTDTLLTAGNGRVWADWAVTGLGEGALVAMPYIGWLSQKHRLPLKFGWCEICLRMGSQALEPHRVKSWYEANAVPVSEFDAGGRRVRAWCTTPPGKALVRLHVELSPARSDEDICVVLRGATTLGEEAGSPFDPVNGTVGSCDPLPSELTAEASDTGFVVRNAPAGIAAHVRCGEPVRAKFAASQVEVVGRGQSITKQQVCFELHCPLAATAEADTGFDMELELVDEPPAQASRQGGRPRSGAAARSTSCEPLGDARRAWDAEWDCLATLRTPDARLTAGLKRAAIYAASMLAPIDGTDEAAGLSDHVEWPVDCARDTFHVASAMLLLKPELARQHLAFTFLDAIPKAGAGRSYVATGQSRGHRDARLLDLAAYPLLELWRYWCATGDDEFAAQPRVRQTALAIVDEVATWEDPRTGLLTSTERSSDERCVFPCFIPGNAMFAACLEHVAQMCQELWHEPDHAARLRTLGERVRQSIYDHGVVEDDEFGAMFAFEVGGPGEFLLYDHADMPNLLSLPRLGFCPADDPVYRNTVRFAYSARNQGYRGTADGKYAQLCDGSKTMPTSPWPLGALGQLMSGAVTAADATRLLDWLRDALTPALQLPEICDKHTAQPVQRYWFGWPTAMLIMAYVETICGLKIDRPMRLEPLTPAGWADFSSPRLVVRGRAVQTELADGKMTALLDGEPVTLEALKHLLASAV